MYLFSTPKQIIKLFPISSTNDEYGILVIEGGQILEENTIIGWERAWTRFRDIVTTELPYMTIPEPLGDLPIQQSHLDEPEFQEEKDDLNSEEQEAHVDEPIPSIPFQGEDDDEDLPF